MFFHLLDFPPRCPRHRLRRRRFRTRFESTSFLPRCPRSFGGGGRVAEITARVAFGVSGKDQQTNMNEPAPLHPPFTGCVKVCVVVGDGGKPAEVQQQNSLQQNTAARAAARAPSPTYERSCLMNGGLWANKCTYLARRRMGILSHRKQRRRVNAETQSALVSLNGKRCSWVQEEIDPVTGNLVWSESDLIPGSLPCGAVFQTRSTPVKRFISIFLV